MKYATPGDINLKTLTYKFSPSAELTDFYHNEIEQKGWLWFLSHQGGKVAEALSADKFKGLGLAVRPNGSSEIAPEDPEHYDPEVLADLKPDLDEAMKSAGFLPYLPISDGDGHRQETTETEEHT